jgi:excinuclease UvrABC nuclease subunit
MLPRSAWEELPKNISGVYVLFDSSETARYVGISNDIRARLGTYFQGNKPEDNRKRQVTVTFSVFMVKNRNHARELESLLVHVFGDALYNRRKIRRFGVRPNMQDNEAGTLLLKRKSIGPPQFDVRPTSEE